MFSVLPIWEYGPGAGEMQGYYRGTVGYDVGTVMVG